MAFLSLKYQPADDGFDVVAAPLRPAIVHHLGVVATVAALLMDTEAMQNRLEFGSCSGLLRAWQMRSCDLAWTSASLPSCEVLWIVLAQLNPVCSLSNVVAIAPATFWYVTDCWAVCHIVITM